jgi:hypothetical protein
MLGGGGGFGRQLSPGSEIVPVVTLAFDGTQVLDAGKIITRSTLMPGSTPSKLILLPMLVALNVPAFTQVQIVGLVGLGLKTLKQLEAPASGVAWTFSLRAVGVEDEILTHKELLPD